MNVLTLNGMTLPVVELSSDGKKVRCTICEELGDHGGALWIRKESLAYHLKSEVHMRSVKAKDHRNALEKASKRLGEQEGVEGVRDFVALHVPACNVHSVVGKPRDDHIISNVTLDFYDFGTGDFDAGTDHSAAAVDERKRLEREANDFDLWHGADFVPEVDPSDGVLLLNELEQDDILTELLQNARTYFQFAIFFSSANDFD
jgi:hypothetical protein